MNAPLKKEDDDIDLEIEDDGPEIEIVDDTPEEDRGRRRRDPDVEPDIPDEDEVSQYKGDVQKRIKQLRWEFHEERRAKEEAERLSQEATNFARQQAEIVRRLQGVIQSGEKTLVDEAKARSAAELAAAKSDYAKAFEEGDSEKVAAAQERMAKAAADAAKWGSYRLSQPPRDGGQPQPQPQQPQRQAVQLSETERKWRDANTWFGKDQRLTSYAMAIHEDLKNEGVRLGSPEYFDRIDQELRDTFPTKFSRRNGSGDRQRAAGQVVAPHARSAPGSRKTIRLTQTQVNLAKRLGITPQQYAEQLMKDAENG